MEREYIYAEEVAMVGEEVISSNIDIANRRRKVMMGCVTIVTLVILINIVIYLLR